MQAKLHLGLGDGVVQLGVGPERGRVAEDGRQQRGQVRDARPAPEVRRELERGLETVFFL